MSTVYSAPCTASAAASITETTRCRVANMRMEISPNTARTKRKGRQHLCPPLPARPESEQEKREHDGQQHPRVAGVVPQICIAVDEQKVRREELDVVGQKAPGERRQRGVIRADVHHGELRRQRARMLQGPHTKHRVPSDNRNKREPPLPPVPVDECESHSKEEDLQPTGAVREYGDGEEDAGEGKA